MVSQKQSIQRDDKAQARRTEHRPEAPNLAPGHPAAIARRARLDPKSLTPHEVLQLQRTVGNRAVGQLLAAPSGPVVQRAFDKELKALGLDAQTMDDPLLQQILAEVLGTKATLNVPVKSGPSMYESEATRKDFAKGQYQVVIDPKQTQDPLKRQSYILHELMHVSADRRYAVNQQLGGSSFQNLVATEYGEQDIENDTIVRLLTDLDKIVRTDQALKKGERAYLQGRVDRMSNTTTELDTVSSELLYYVTKMGLDKGSDTYKAIRNLAEWTYRRRQTGLPVPPPKDLTDPPSTGELPPLQDIQAPPKSKKKGPCYITTACVTARGLPDDCEELTALRAFRDGYMRSQADGPALIAEYYRRAPAIVAAIQARDDAAAIFDRLFEVIQQCVRLIHDGQHRVALETYRTMALRLQAEYASWPKSAPTAVRRRRPAASPE
jgi:hypothetical protein